MAGVRNNLNARVSVLNSIGPVSTATLGVEGTAIDVRDYPKGSRFVAIFNIGTMTEGTLTPSVVDCDTSGGTYAATTDLYGTLSAVTTSNDESVQMQGFQPAPGRPFIKLKLVETVSVTTAVAVSCSFLVIPPAVV